MIFLVRNVVGEEHWKNVTAKENPYDFIYNIVIELDDKQIESQNLGTYEIT